jgi:hypothetical protein
MKKLLKEIPGYAPIAVAVIYIIGYLALGSMLSTYGIYESVAFDIRDVTAGGLFIFLNLPIAIVLFISYQEVTNGKDFYLSLIDVKLKVIPFIFLCAIYLTPERYSRFHFVVLFYYFGLVVLRYFYKKIPRYIRVSLVLCEYFIPQIILAVFDTMPIPLGSYTLKFYYMFGHLLTQYVILFLVFRNLRSIFYLAISMCIVVNVEAVLFFGCKLLPNIQRAFGGEKPLTTRMYFDPAFLKTVLNSEIKPVIKNSNSEVFTIVFDTPTKYYILKDTSIIFFIPKSKVLTYEDKLNSNYLK